jgi:hypothetical protein
MWTTADERALCRAEFALTGLIGLLWGLGVGMLLALAALGLLF